MKFTGYMQQSSLNLSSEFQHIMVLDKGIIGIFLVAMVTSFHKNIKSKLKTFDSEKGKLVIFRRNPFLKVKKKQVII